MDIPLASSYSITSKDSVSSLRRFPEVTSKDVDVPATRRVLDSEDISLWALIYEDVNFCAFLKFTGYYITYDYRDHIVKRIITRIWQISLFSLTTIGFFWDVVGYGALALKLTFKQLNTSFVNEMINLSYVCYDFIVPILQVASLCYSLYNLKILSLPVINVSQTNKQIAECKRDIYIYFVIMALLVLIIDSLPLNKQYFAQYDDDYYSKIEGTDSYSSWLFSTATTGLFFNFGITSYLSVVMFFKSLLIKQISSLQEQIILSIQDDTITVETYYQLKERALLLQKNSHVSLQLLTVTSGVNLLCWIYMLWALNSQYNSDEYGEYLNTQDKIITYLLNIPFLFKEIVFFFYILWKSSLVNERQLSLTALIAEKSNSIIKSRLIEGGGSRSQDMYTSFYIDSTRYPIEVKFIGIYIRRTRIIFLLITAILYTVRVFMAIYKIKV